MNFTEICAKINEKFSFSHELEMNSSSLQGYIFVPKNILIEICAFLKSNKDTYFDSLSCVTAIDSPATSSFEIDYRLYSIIHNHHFCIKIRLPRNYSIENQDEFQEVSQVFLPKAPSLSSIWRTADWHEREAYDLMGIYFENHPDLRRILLPADWQGHPLRKDYVAQELYQEIKVKY